MDISCDRIILPMKIVNEIQKLNLISKVTSLYNKPGHEISR